MVTAAKADAGALLIDSVMPTYDAAIAEHIIVAADPATTFAAVRGLDLLTVLAAAGPVDVAAGPACPIVRHNCAAHTQSHHRRGYGTAGLDVSRPTTEPREIAFALSVDDMGAS